MAQISFEDFSRMPSESSNNNNLPGYFTLKNNGDEALVRFMYSSTADFNIYTIHPINIKGKYRECNCLRNANAPLSECPLCESGTSIRQSFYIKLLQYTTNPDGSVVTEAKVWSRSGAYINKLAGLINEYGDLKNVVFKVRRNGASGSMDTTYDILFANPNVYTPERYPLRDDLFANFSPFQGFCLNKNRDEMNYFIEHGEFPVRENRENTQPSAETTTTYNPQAQQDPVFSTAAYVNNNSRNVNTPNPSINPAYDYTPAGMNNNQSFGSEKVQRPVRTY